MRSFAVASWLTALLAKATSEHDKLNARGVRDYVFHGCAVEHTLDTDFRKIVTLNRESLFPAICGSICHELYVATIRGDCYCAESIDGPVDTTVSECAPGVPTIWIDEKFGDISEATIESTSKETPEQTAVEESKEKPTSQLKETDKETSSDDNTDPQPKVNDNHTNQDSDEEGFFDFDFEDPVDPDKQENPSFGIHTDGTDDDSEAGPWGWEQEPEHEHPEPEPEHEHPEPEHEHEHPEPKHEYPGPEHHQPEHFTLEPPDYEHPSSKQPENCEPGHSEPGYHEPAKPKNPEYPSHGCLKCQGPDNPEPLVVEDVCNKPDCAHTEYPETQVIEVCDNPDCQAPQHHDPDVVEVVCPECGYPGSKNLGPQAHEPESIVHPDGFEPYNPGYNHMNSEGEFTVVASEPSEKLIPGGEYNSPQEEGGHHAKEEGKESLETKVQFPAESTFSVHLARPTHASTGGNSTVMKPQEPTQVALGFRMVESMSTIIIAIGIALLV